MVELVDMWDLGSHASKAYGFESLYPHHCWFYYFTNVRVEGLHSNRSNRVGQEERQMKITWGGELESLMVLLSMRDKTISLSGYMVATNVSDYQ